MSIEARLVNIEGVTVHVWQIPRLEPYLDTAVPTRLRVMDYANPDADTTSSIRTCRWDLDYLIGPADGGPIAIYRQRNLW